MAHLINCSVPLDTYAGYALCDCGTSVPVHDYAKSAVCPSCGTTMEVSVVGGITTLETPRKTRDNGIKSLTTCSIGTLLSKAEYRECEARVVRCTILLFAI